MEAIGRLEDTVEGFRQSFAAEIQQALSAALAAAAERLREVEIQLDGSASQTIDPSKHRVVKSSAPPGRLPNRVKAIWRPGVRFMGQRIRQAEVVAEYVEGSDGTNWD